MCHFIRAACTLHNIALDENLPLNNDQQNLPPIPNPVEEQDDEHGDEEADDVGATIIRDRVANALPI